MTDTKRVLREAQERLERQLYLITFLRERGLQTALPERTLRAYGVAFMALEYREKALDELSRLGFVPSSKFLRDVARQAKPK